MAEFASSITKRGSLQKLPRGSRVGLSLLGGSPWQERDFVLEGDSLAYYAPGQGGFAKHLKGELRLAGCGVAACDGFVHGRVNCFKVTTAGGDRGDVVLSAETSAEAEAWIVAVRSAARGAGAAAPRPHGDLCCVALWTRRMSTAERHARGGEGYRFVGI